MGGWILYMDSGYRYCIHISNPRYESGYGFYLDYDSSRSEVQMLGNAAVTVGASSCNRAKRDGDHDGVKP